jgi:hypothetical protein
MKARTRATTIAGLVLGLLFASVPAAEAAHHLIKIRQVYPGQPGGMVGNNNEYVVLQLTNAGENQFGNSVTVTLYDADGNPANTAVSTGIGDLGPIGVSTNQSAILAATSSALVEFSMPAEMAFASNTDIIRPSGGAACVTSDNFGPLDCVGWGNLVLASPPSPIDALEPAIPDGKMLERSISPNCGTLHEFADDTNNSANDFAPADPTPRNSMSMIPEMSCGTTPPLGGGGGGSTNPGTTATPPRKCKKGQKLVKGKCRKKKRKK